MSSSGALVGLFQATELPRMVGVRQRFPRTPPLDIPRAVAAALDRIKPGIRPGARLAVAVGSRGIQNLETIVAAVVRELQSAGAKPFLVPAMGSHGGATAEGQVQLLAEYGVTQQSLGIPFHPAMDAEEIGQTEDGVPVYFSREALAAEGIVVVNRVKPHTDFQGLLGSGLLKMLVVGLGKRSGASLFHRASNRLGFEHVLRTSARVLLARAPILAGVAIVENQFHDTARIHGLVPAEFEREEERLCEEARQLMPRLPFHDIDLLIVDRLGKNISGSGMDPNVIGRGVHGYSSLLKDRAQDTPAVRRLFVRELTPESHGNATGVGVADFTTTRLVQSMDRHITTINTLTAMAPQGCKIPIHFDTDREVLRHAMDTLALSDYSQARILRIRDTLDLEVLQASEVFTDEIRDRADLELLSSPAALAFDAQGNLLPLGVTASL